MNSSLQGKENQQLYFVFVEYTPFLFPVGLWQVVPAETATRLWAQAEEKEIIKLVIAQVTVYHLLFFLL